MVIAKPHYNCPRTVDPGQLFANQEVDALRNKKQALYLIFVVYIAKFVIGLVNVIIIMNVNLLFPLKLAAMYSL